MIYDEIYTVVGKEQPIFQQASDFFATERMWDATITTTLEIENQDYMWKFWTNFYWINQIFAQIKTEMSGVDCTLAVFTI